jgi:hypothetical protein
LTILPATAVTQEIKEVTQETKVATQETKVATQVVLAMTLSRRDRQHQLQPDLLSLLIKLMLMQKLRRSEDMQELLKLPRAMQKPLVMTLNISGMLQMLTLEMLLRFWLT